MPHHIERLTDAPIIVITFEGAVDAAAVSQTDAAIEQMLRAHPVNSALIFDTTSAQTDFQHILGILQATRGGDDQPDLGFSVLVAFVGTSAMVKLYVDAARQKQFGAQTLPLFATLDDAVSAMRVALDALTEKNVLP